MISGAHVVLYTQHTDTVRAFFDEVLGLPGVDAGGGWPIFALPPCELAVHPAEEEGTQFQLYLMCDDLDRVIDSLRDKASDLAQPVTEQRWGRVTAVRVAEGVELGMYEPRHPL